MPSKHIHEFTCVASCVIFDAIDGAFDIHYVDADGKEIPPDQVLKPSNKAAAPAKWQLVPGNKASWSPSMIAV